MNDFCPQEVVLCNRSHWKVAPKVKFDHTQYLKVYPPKKNSHQPPLERKLFVRTREYLYSELRRRKNQTDHLQSSVVFGHWSCSPASLHRTLQSNKFSSCHVFRLNLWSICIYCNHVRYR